MTIKLEQELIVTSDKSIDVRGTNMEIRNAAGITVQFVKNVIIHGLHIHQIIPAKGGKKKDGEKHLGLRSASDVDRIFLFRSNQHLARSSFPSPLRRWSYRCPSRFHYCYHF
ncbi:hypothetical protein Gotri_026756 [Gossypium trilobum]|uniref:Pectate lyase n=1 Tax=Gossypium trilobum TaxID=34281 RepID=A0A7J9FWD6_9ROSI|nr:hypothetical protein [Gossypium trilobum]